MYSFLHLLIKCLLSAWYVSDILLGIKVITVGIKAKTERKGKQPHFTEFILMGKT